MKKRLSRALFLIDVISIGTFLACTVIYGLFILSSGQSIAQAEVPYILLWEIISVGVVCGVGTEIILGRVLNGDELSGFGIKIRYAVHYIFINAVVLGLGYFFKWYVFVTKGIVLMCVTIAAVYGFTTLTGYLISVNDAGKMNKKLKRFHTNK